MATQIEPTGATPAWNPPEQILFRFAFVYLVLYILPFPLNIAPYGEEEGANITQPYIDLWNQIVPWVGENVFQVEITVLPNSSGSGDTTYNYVQVFCFLVLAAAVAVVWTLLDRKRASYVWLYEWLRVYVRFYLATMMIVYGAMKIIKSQFPNPSLDRLIQPFGDASPMGLLWTFMGASESYNIFAGASEMLGGLLLTARRTTLLGALVSLGVLSNIVMLNFSYDVPVKLFSCHLFAMAVFLAVPDLRRLARFFVLNRPVESAEIRPLFGRKWLRYSAVVLRTAFVVGFVGNALADAHHDQIKWGDLRPTPPLYGLWEVLEFTVDGEMRPPLVTDLTRWRRVIFDDPERLGIHFMSDSRQRYNWKVDTEKKTMELSKREDAAWKSAFTFMQPELDLLVLEGTFDGRNVRAKIRRTDAAKFLLVNRGFHWINEYPFNR